MKHAKLSEKWKRMAVLQMLAHTMLLPEDFSRTTRRFDRWSMQSFQKNGRGWLSSRCLLIQCCCLRISPEQREDLIDEACIAFRKMEEDGCPPDVCSYNVIVWGFLQNNNASRAEQRCINGRTTYFVYAHFRVEEWKLVNSSLDD